VRKGESDDKSGNGRWDCCQASSTSKVTTDCENISLLIKHGPHKYNSTAPNKIKIKITGKTIMCNNELTV
jgi:hypothetical protein